MALRAPRGATARGARQLRPSVHQEQPAIRDQEQRGVGSAALSCAARDRFLGWSREAQYARLRHVVNNQRFCVLPAGGRPNLASAVLARVLRRLAGDYRFVGRAVALLLHRIDVQRPEPEDSRPRDRHRLPRQPGTRTLSRVPSLPPRGLGPFGKLDVVRSDVGGRSRSGSRSTSRRIARTLPPHKTALRTRRFRSCRTEGLPSGCARSCRTVRSRVPRSAIRDVTLSPSGPLEDGVVADAAPSQAELIVDGDELERCAAIGTGE